MTSKRVYAMTNNNVLVPISEAKGRLSEIVRESDSRDVLLMRHGRPAAVVMSHARHEALLERLEDALDRLSVHERSGLTMEYEKLSTELRRLRGELPTPVRRGKRGVRVSGEATAATGLPLPHEITAGVTSSHP